MKWFFKGKALVDTLIKALLGVLTCAICIVVLWQVFTRFVLKNPSSWTEEVCRYMLIWISMIGGSLGLSNGTHMSLVLVTDRIKNRFLKALVHIFAYIVCGAVGYVFIRYGYLFAMSGMSRTMMCCGFPMGYIYMVIPVCGVIIMINCLGIILEDIAMLRGVSDDQKR